MPTFDGYYAWLIISGVNDIAGPRVGPSAVTNEDSTLGGLGDTTFDYGGQTYAYLGTVEDDASGFAATYNGDTYYFSQNGSQYTETQEVTAGYLPGTQVGLVCYLRGTRIMTVAGEVPVEDLKPGDMLVTRFGPLRPVKWIGRQSFNGRFLGQKRAPICFRAGSIAPGVPARDLRVSPFHNMVIDDTLVVARLLVNGVTITQSATDEMVDYFHIDLGEHDCIIADGAWSESYNEQDNRGEFHNAAEFGELWPEHRGAIHAWCLPQITGHGPALVAVWEKLAKQLPPGSFTDDADLHLVADGGRIDPSVAASGSWQFEVPAGVRNLRLMSRAINPAHGYMSHDERRLGFCLEGITVATPAETRSFKANHREFGDGTHELEEWDGRFRRWTDGDCRLPDALLAGIDEPATVVVTGTPLPRYPTAPVVQSGVTGTAILLPAYRRSATG